MIVFDIMCKKVNFIILILAGLVLSANQAYSQEGNEGNSYLEEQSPSSAGQPIAGPDTIYYWMDGEEADASLPREYQEKIDSIIIHHRSVRYLDCSSVQLSTNPILCDSTQIHLNLTGNAQVDFFVFHADGTLFSGLQASIQGTDGYNEWNMKDLFPTIFDQGISPFEPLILSVSVGKTVSLSYFYVNRTQGNN